MTKAKGKPRPHRPSFGQIARTLPEVGSAEARLLSHVLRCELCTDAALSILEIGNRTPKRKAPDYDAAFAAAAAKATAIFEQRMRAVGLAEELLKIPDTEAKRRRAQELARVEPWSVTVSLLEAAKLLLQTDPNRAAEVAKLAVVAAEEMNPQDHPPALRLLTQAHLLVGESLYRAREQAEEAEDEVEMQYAELLAGGKPLFLPFRLRRRRPMREALEDFDV